MELPSKTSDASAIELMADELRKTERRLNVLLEQVPHVILYETGGGREYISPSVERLLGYPASSFAEDITLFPSLMHPHDAHSVREELKLWRAAGRPGVFVSHFRVRKASGEYIWLEDHVIGVIEDGRESIIGVLVDISNRRAEQQRYQAIAEAANVAGIALAIYADRGGVPTTIYRNEAASKLANWSSGEVEGRSVFDFLPPESFSEVERLWSKFLRGELVHHQFETVMLHKDGHKVPLSVGLSVTKMGDEPAIIAFLTDISEQKRTEQALIAAKLEAEEMSRVKSNILANFSHELRTPMHSILGFSGLLIEELQDPELKQYVQSIEKSGQRLLATLTSILEVASLETSPGEIILHPLPLATTVREELGRFRPLIESKGLELTLDFDEPDPIVLIDRIRFGKAFEKVLSNALKFTQSGKISLEVHIEPRTSKLGKPERRAILTIRDTGIGMSKEFLAAAFEKFKQESTGFSRSFEGTGLGLTLARGYLHLMNGDIALESELGVGTTVTLSLPALGASSVTR